MTPHDHTQCQRHADSHAGPHVEQHDWPLIAALCEWCDRHWDACLHDPCRQRVEVEGHPLDEDSPNIAEKED